MPSSAILAPPEAPAQLPDLYEIVNGEVREKIMSLLSTEIASAIDQMLGAHVRTHRLGKVFCEAIFRFDVDADLQRRPDVAFVSNRQLPWDRPAPNTAAPDIIPELVVEVVSPSNTFNDVQDKIDEYFTAGVRRVWVVMPAQQRVAIYTSPTEDRILTRNDTLEDSELFPGFKLPLSSIFLAEEPR